MNELYEPPVITRLVQQRMNKFAVRAASGAAARQRIDGVPVAELVARYGSPLFVFSERTLRRKYRQYHRAFSTRYPRVAFGWSYKTNYLRAICQIMHQEGALAEVVSTMEFEKARALGVPGSRILFNGPNKSRAAIEAALRAGAHLHVDHDDELSDVADVAESLGRTCDIGLRLNLDAGITPVWSRFGFNLESGQAWEAVRRMAHGGRLRLAGLHCHIGTYVLDPSAYARQVQKLLEFAYRVEDAFGYRIDYLDVGGGFPSQSRLKGAYLPPDVSVPAVDEYAEAICDALHAGLRPGHTPALVLESGRALVDEAGSLVTSVVASKRLPDGQRAYVVDAGINLLYTAFWYQFRIETETPHAGLTEPSAVYGPMCMNIDCLAERVDLPPLARGERLIVSPVGAYNTTQWLQFIEYRPAVVLVGESGRVDVIRQREDLSDLERRELLPDHLRTDAPAAACWPN